MPVFNNALAGGSFAAADGYEIERSLRFNSGDSAYLNRTPSSAGNQKTFTFSTWLKLSDIGTGKQTIFSAGNNSALGQCLLEYDGSYQQLWFRSSVVGGTMSAAAYTTALFRDPSAWYHLVMSVDTTQGTEADRVKLYINGVSQPFTTYSISLNGVCAINSASLHQIGRSVSTSSDYLNSYLADVHFIDGQALAPTDFGETDDNNVWQPKKFAGTYGTNGFHLDFADNSSNAALGTDTSGNSNTWTVNNLSIGGSGWNQSQTWSATGDTPYSGYSWSGGFNGQLGATIAADGKSVYAVGPVTLTLPVTLSGTWRCWGCVGGSVGGTEYIKLLDASDSQITSTSVPYGQSNAAWFDIGSASNVKKVKIYAMGFFALELDGQILVDSGVIDPLDAGNDSLLDTPTNGDTASDTGAGGEITGNYCTLNPLQNINNDTFSDGNLKVVTGSSTYGTFTTTMATPLSGKWYAEVNVISTTGLTMLGLCSTAGSFTATKQIYLHDSVSYYANNGNRYINSTTAAYGAAYTSGDVIGIAYDADGGSVTFYKNGVSQGAIIGITVREYYFAGSDLNGGGSDTHVWNFGQRAFAYAAPSGYKSLNTANLPEPTIADGSLYFDTKLYTSTGADLSVTGLQFSPDFVWVKNRQTANRHAQFDIVRGANKYISSTRTNAETTTSGSGYGTGTFNSFDANGFTLGDDVGVNVSNYPSGQPHVAWAWDAGTSTVTNTDGTITSQVRANPSAGFSIVSYTGNGTNDATFGHGLNAAPEFIIVKRRDSADDWFVYSLPTAGNILKLNSTSAKSGSSHFRTMSSSTFQLSGNADVNANNGTYIAYCFAPVAGYSAISSYTGNGSADGPFVYTGFRPAFVLFKTSSVAGNDWYIYDNKRETEYNPTEKPLFPNGAIAEQPDNRPVDFLSNGLKIRYNQFFNASGATIIYAAFAENPFKTARAR